MNGLKYIREMHGFSLSDLAIRLGISRQAISMWEQEKKKIPGKRLKQLVEFFNISEKYFGEVTEQDLLDIDNLRLNQKLVDSIYEYKDIEIDEDGCEHEVTRTGYDNALSTMIDYNCGKIMVNKVLKKVEDAIFGKINGSIYDEIEHIKEYSKLYEQFTNLAKNKNVDIRILFKIIAAAANSFHVNQEKSDEWGEENKLDKGYINGNDKDVKDLADCIKRIKSI